MSTSTSIQEQVNTDYHIVKEELWDADVMDVILRDPQFSTTLKRHLGNYKKAKTHGARKQVIYHFGKGCNENQVGRLFVKDYEGLQAFPRDIRNPLLQKNYWDIDVENCHYWIMRQFCDKAGIKNEAIARYCDNRDAELKRVSNNRDVAKTAFLKTAYGGNVKNADLNNPEHISDDGIDPEGDISLIKLIEKEIKTVINYVKGAYPDINKIAVDVCKRKKEWANKKGKKIPWNADYTTLALTLQTEERKILVTIDNFFRSKGRQMDILIHDGGMVRKLENEMFFPEQLLREAEAYVKEKLDYTIHLVNKPIAHNFKVPEKQVDTIDDEYAARKFVSLMLNNILYQDNYIYFYDEERGMWDHSDDAYRRAVSKFKTQLIFKQLTDRGEKTYNYGGSEKNVMAMRKWLSTCIEPSSDMQPSASKYCLLFKNGWIDMRTMTFYEGFQECRNKFFTKMILRDFEPRRNYELEAEIKKIMFQNPYNKKEIGEFYANGIARAIAGIVEDKLYWGIVGNPDCGKGTMTQFLTYVFQSYIGIFNLNALKYNPRDGTDEARKLSWYVPLIGTRIIISNEARQDGKSLDGNLMKTLSSGGDTIVIRGCNQNELLVIPTSTSFSFVNDFPKVAPCDKAFKNRIMCVPHTKSFVNKMQEECNQYEMQADPQLKTKIMRPDWINAFFWIIMDAYNNGIKYEMPQEVAAEADELFIVEDVKLKEVMEERWAFVATEVTEKEGNMPNNFVSSRDILDYLQESGIRMSDATVGRELKKLGLIKTSIKVNKRTIRGWLGLSE